MPIEPTNSFVNHTSTASGLNILRESNLISSAEINNNICRDQASIINYFYTAILKYVVVDVTEIPHDTLKDSDDEPSYSTEPGTQDIETKISESTFNLSDSKLIQSYNRLKQSQIWAQSSIIGMSIQKSLLLKIDKLKANSSKKSIEVLNKPKKNTIVSLNLPEQDIATLMGENSARKSDDLTGKLSWFDQENCGSKRVSLKFTTGVIYCGDVDNNRFHGKGVYTWPNGISYEGDFKEGCCTGYGKLTFTDLSYYQGSFVNGILEGEGIFCASYSPAFYAGSWSNGVPHGKGCLTYSESDYYEGNWRYGQKHGHGIRMYPNNAVYSGNWIENRPNGQGSMVFANKDFYQGQWSYGKPHGQGQYTWCADLRKGMTFSIVKQYKGHFANGLRDGFGEQSFGMEGSKIVSQFDGDMKSGSGIIICGDGNTIEKKQLFYMDNPVGRKLGVDNSRIINVIKRKPTISKARVSFCAFRLKNSSISNVLEKNKIMETFPAIDTSGSPLCLPLHATAMDISLDYHMKRLLNYCKYHQIDKDPYVTTSGIYYLPIRSIVKSRKDRAKTSIQIEKISQLFQDNEYRLLSRAIANNFVLLKKIYRMYATLNPLHSCCPEYRNPCLNRLRLWQFLRDIKISKYKISLIDIDNMLLDIPNIHLESEHYPFEPIYFWQFIHCLLLLSYIGYTLSILSYSKEPIKVEAKYNDIFKNFIEEMIKPNEGIFQGRALFTYKDLLPINKVYKLYVKIGEPHSARRLLNKICNRKGEPPLDCLIKTKEFCEMPAPKTHFVLSGSTILYVAEKNNNPWMMEPKSVRIERDDPFYTDLKVFRVLGPKKVVQCIAQVCENVKEGKDLVNMDYQIAFLEFYEILINLAEELNKVRMRTARKEMVKNNVEEEVKTEVVIVKHSEKKKGKKKKAV